MSNKYNITYLIATNFISEVYSCNDMIKNKISSALLISLQFYKFLIR